MKAEAFASAHQNSGSLSVPVPAGRNEGGGFRLRAQRVDGRRARPERRAAMKAEAFASAHSPTTTGRST